MIQPKKEKKTTEEKKVNRPDTPLAATPVPASVGTNESQRLGLESMKGSALKLMQERRAKDTADKAMKEAALKRGMDVISRNQQY